MHRDDRFGARSHPLGDLSRVHIEGVGTDVHEHRFGSQARDGAGGREERVRNRHDFVPWPHAADHERQENGIGAGRYPDGVGCAQVSLQVFLQIGDPRAQNKGLLLAHRLERGHHFGPYLTVLGF